jgi:hypothetical protein
MTDLLRSSEPNATVHFLNPRRAREVSKAGRQLLSRLILLFGLLLVFGTLFASIQAMEICSASLKAIFCR